MQFVDREEELERLLGLIDRKISIVIYGLRGVGKTSLLKALETILVGKGRSVIFINGYEIAVPRDVGVLVGVDTDDGRLVLSELFAEDDAVIIIDEFTAFLRIFVGKRGFPSLSRVAMFLRTLIEKRRIRGGSSVILCSSSIGMVKRLTKKYFAPLFRRLKLVYVGLIPLDSAIELAEQHCRDYSREVVELVRGFPFYIIKMCEEINLGKKPLEALEYLLSDPSGDLNIYFEALYEKFSPPEKYILHLIARGITRYSKISERLVTDPNIYLKRLMLNGIIKKIKRGAKEVHYELVDPVFKAWLATQEIPSLGKIMLKTITVTSLSFEAMIREMFRELPQQVEIRDSIGQKITIEPPKKVMRYIKSNIEIDALLIYGDDSIVVECHFWGPAKPEKIDQLEKNAKYVNETLGLKIRDKILISYFGFEEKTKQKAKQRNIKLLSARELKEIQKKTKKYWGF